MYRSCVLLLECSHVQIIPFCTVYNRRYWQKRTQRRSHIYYTRDSHLPTHLSNCTCDLPRIAIFQMVVPSLTHGLLLRWRSCFLDFLTYPPCSLFIPSFLVHNPCFLLKFFGFPIQPNQVLLLFLQRILNESRAWDRKFLDLR